MMSSFASVFVANANATPEKVVPWKQSEGRVRPVHSKTFCVQNRYQQSVAPCFFLHLQPRPLVLDYCIGLGLAEAHSCPGLEHIHLHILVAVKRLLRLDDPEGMLLY